MSIVSLDNYIAAAKQRALWQKTAARTTVAGTWFSLFELAGDPGAGTLAVGNTANGIVPASGDNGYPKLNAFGVSAVGYLGRVFASNTVQSRVQLFDKLFAAGAYAFNANVTLNTQPVYSGRLPAGPDYNGLEIWVECVTAFTGIPSVAVTYTNQGGTPGHTTGTVSLGSALTIGRMVQLPLQAGDSGLQKIESVVGTVASVGTFNVYVMRQLHNAWISTANEGNVYDFLKTGLPQVFATSALFVNVLAPVGTSSGTPTCDVDVVNN